MQPRARRDEPIPSAMTGYGLRRKRGRDEGESMLFSFTRLHLLRLPRSHPLQSFAGPPAAPPRLAAPNSSTEEASDSLGNAAVVDGETGLVRLDGVPAGGHHLGEADAAVELVLELVGVRLEAELLGERGAPARAIREREIDVSMLCITTDHRAARAAEADGGYALVRARHGAGCFAGRWSSGWSEVNATSAAGLVFEGRQVQTEQ